MGVELAVSPESFEVVVKHLLRKARTNVSMMSKETKGSEDVRLQAVLVLRDHDTFCTIEIAGMLLLMRADAHQ